MYRFIKIILIVAFLLTNISASNNKSDKVSLQLLWKHQFEFAGFYMAKEKGYYKDVNLEVELKEFQFGTNITQDVVNGKSTFGIGYPSIILDKANGADIVLLKAILQSSPHALVSLKSSGIKSIDDFKGKRLMTVDDSIQTASFKSMLFSKKIRFEDMKILPTDFKIESLIANKTDIMSIYLSNEIYKLDNLKLEYNIWDPKDHGFDFYNDLLFTSTIQLKQNPQLVDKFQKASMKGWHYAFENIEESVELILKKYNTQNKTKEALLYEASVLRNLALTPQNSIGDVDKNKIQRIYDIYNLMGLTNNTIDLDQFIYSNTKAKLTLLEKEWIKNNIVKIGISPWNPITYYDVGTGKIDGMGYELLKIVIDKLKLNVEFTTNPWSILLDDFKNKKIDLLPTTYYTEQRASYGDFSKPYLNIKEYLYVRKKSKINSFHDLKNKKIAMVKSYGAISSIKKKFPKIKIIELDNLEQTLEYVLNGKADALFNTQASVDTLMRSNFISGLKAIYQTDLESSPLHYFINKDKPILKSILQKGLDDLSNDEKAKVIHKWLSKTQNIIKLSHKEQEYLDTKKEIKMCVDPDWMPFEMIENGQHVGLASDYIKIVSESLNIPFRVIDTTSWDQSIQKAKNRECDIFSMVITTPDRKKYMDFTSAYLDMPMVIATKQDEVFIDNIRSVLSRPIGIVKGYALATILKKRYPKINIVDVDSINDGLKKVESGKIYAFIDNLATVNYEIQKKFIGTIKISGRLDERVKYRLASRNDEPILHSILEKAVLQIDSSQKEEIFNKWISVPKQEVEIDYTILFYILSVVVVVILFMFYKQYLLKESINEFKELIDATMEGILLSKDGVCIDVNESALEIFKLESKEDVVGKSPLIYVADESKKLVAKNFNKSSTKAYEVDYWK